MEHLPFEIAIFLLELIKSCVHHTSSCDDEDSEDVQEEPQWWLKVGIDANLLGYKYVHDPTLFEPDGTLTHIAQAFSDSLVDVLIVCDHLTEHHSLKWATCEHQAEAENEQFNLWLPGLNYSLCWISKTTPANAMQKCICSLENASKQRLPPNISKKLEAFIAGFNSEGKGDVKINIAPTQADPVVTSKNSFHALP